MQVRGTKKLAGFDFEANPLNPANPAGLRGLAGYAFHRAGLEKRRRSLFVLVNAPCCGLCVLCGVTFSPTHITRGQEALRATARSRGQSLVNSATLFSTKSPDITTGGRP